MANHASFSLVIKFPTMYPAAGRYPAERLQPGALSPQRQVPPHIPRPAYAVSGSAPGQLGLSKQPEVHDGQVCTIRGTFESWVSVRRCIMCMQALAPGAFCDLRLKAFPQLLGVD